MFNELLQNPNFIIGGIVLPPLFTLLVGVLTHLGVRLWCWMDDRPWTWRAYNPVTHVLARIGGMERKLNRGYNYYGKGNDSRSDDGPGIWLAATGVVLLFFPTFLFINWQPAIALVCLGMTGGVFVTRSVIRLKKKLAKHIAAVDAHKGGES